MGAMHERGHGPFPVPESHGNGDVYDREPGSPWCRRGPRSDRSRIVHKNQDPDIPLADPRSAFVTEVIALARKHRKAVRARPSRRAATPCCSPACGGLRRRDRHHRPGRLRGPPRRRLEDQQDRGGCRVPVGGDGAGQVQGSRARAPAGTRPGEQQRPVHAVDPADGSTDAAGTSGSQRLGAGARRRHRSVAHRQRADAPSGIFRQMLLRAPFMSQRGDASKGVAGGLVAAFGLYGWGVEGRAGVGGDVHRVAHGAVREAAARGARAGRKRPRWWPAVVSSAGRAGAAGGRVLPHEPHHAAARSALRLLTCHRLPGYPAPGSAACTKAGAQPGPGRRPAVDRGRHPDPGP